MKKMNIETAKKIVFASRSSEPRERFPKLRYIVKQTTYRKNFSEIYKNLKPYICDNKDIELLKEEPFIKGSEQYIQERERKKINIAQLKDMFFNYCAGDEQIFANTYGGNYLDRLKQEEII